MQFKDGDRVAVLRPGGSDEVEYHARYCRQEANICLVIPARDELPEDMVEVAVERVIKATGNDE